MPSPNWTAGAGTGNWDTVGNWSTGAKPVDGDTVTFLASAPMGPNVGMDRSTEGAGGLNVALMQSEAGVRYDIGSNTAPLRCRGTKIVHRGYSTMHFKTDGTTTATTALLVVQSNHPQALVLDGKASAGGAITVLAAFGGGIRIKSSMADAAIADCYVSNTPGLRIPSILVEESPTPNGIFTEVHIVNAAVTDNRGYNFLLVVCGGVYDANFINSTAIAILAGIVNLNGAGTEGQVVHLGGTLDLLHGNSGSAKVMNIYARNRNAVELLYDPEVHTFTDTLLA